MFDPFFCACKKKKMRSILFVIAFVSFSSVGFSESKPEPQTVTKQDFKDQFIPAFTNILCKKGQFFRECFKVTSDECLSELTSATEACFAKLYRDIPNKLKQPDDGRAWGTKIGMCAGGTFETTLKLAKKFIDNADCKDPKKWANIK